jgi:hypothetical protein
MDGAAKQKLQAHWYEGIRWSCFASGKLASVRRSLYSLEATTSSWLLSTSRLKTLWQQNSKAIVKAVVERSVKSWLWDNELPQSHDLSHDLKPCSVLHSSSTGLGP